MFTGRIEAMKPVIKFRRAAVVLAILICVMSLSVSAARKDVSVIWDGSVYQGKTELLGEVTYVSLREFANYAGGAEILWNQTTRTATVKTHALTLTASTDRMYMEANGRSLWCAYGIYVEDGRIYVPLRAVATAFGYELTWNASSFTAALFRTQSALVPSSAFYSKDDVYWLSHIISAEARGESLYGKLAVGSVVMNRVASDTFPNTVYKVIFDKKNGVQFTPTVNGEIYKTPDAESMVAAKLCLEGYRVSKSILFFINESLAESLWITNNCSYVMTVGNHDFYA